jgi:subtilisin family serine protease
MNKIFFIVGLLVATVFAEVPLIGMDSSSIVPGSYLIIFHPNSTEEQQSLYITKLSKILVGQTINSFKIGTFAGFSAYLSEEQLALQRSQESIISYIEADQVVHASACSQQTNADWGLDRIDQDSPNIDGNYRYDSASGQGVDAYIVDTGIYVSHVDFGGRAVWGANFADTNNNDCNGHGTHVAGTVGGTTYGVAKKTTLIAVKVLACNGSGTIVGVVNGINYVASQASKTKRPSVANMSLGGGKSPALNDAVTAAVAAGISFVVAAGNENQDACNTSPASTPTAITVGATTIDDMNEDSVDARSYFSNYGKCVTVLAPGELITSAWIGSTTAIRTISGTSMASPHVAGVVALYLQGNPNASPSTVKSYISSSSQFGLINMACASSACTNTPNLLLHHECD